MTHPLPNRRATSLRRNALKHPSYGASAFVLQVCRGDSIFCAPLCRDKNPMNSRLPESGRKSEAAAAARAPAAWSLISGSYIGSRASMR